MESCGGADEAGAVVDEAAGAHWEAVRVLARAPSRAVRRSLSSRIGSDVPRHGRGQRAYTAGHDGHGTLAPSLRGHLGREGGGDDGRRSALADGSGSPGQPSAEDSAAGLPPEARLYRGGGADLDLFHPWGLTVEESIELAKRSAGFDWKKLPKKLRVAIDSSPLEGAGRVEDTMNLLSHAARNVLACAATLLDRTVDDIATCAGAPLLTASSIKKALDREWSDPKQKADAVVILVEQLDRLQAWLSEQMPRQAEQPPLAEHLETLRQLRAQDLEPDPSGGGPRIRHGVAEDRRVSVQDKDMRHGRKSKSKRFNGYKRHVAADLDTDLIVACAITPANRPEEEATPQLQADIARLPNRCEIGQLHIDRGYIGSSLVNNVLHRRGEVLCKPWVPRNANRFTKGDFRIDMRRLTITCPAGQVERFEPGSVVEFDPEACDRCSMRSSCTMAAAGSGRTINIAADEQLQQRLRKLVATPTGRQRLRERVAVEHRLAHVGRKQGRRARYTGSRKNLFDLRRAATVVNLETIHRHDIAAAA